MALVLALGFEGTGSTITDSSASGNNGTLVAGTRVAGQSGYGNAVQTTGSGITVTVPHQAALSSTTLTVSAWVYHTNTSGYQTLVFKPYAASPGSNNMVYALYTQNGSNALEAWVNGNGPVNGGTVSVNTWTHVAFVINGTNVTLYVNATQVGTGTAANVSDPVSQPLQIGSNNEWNEHFVGIIDELRVYNHAQSQSEIETDMNTPIVSQATGATVDLTGQGLTATLNDVSIAADANVDLAGQSASTTLNNVSVDAGASADLVGQSSTTTLNDVSVATGSAATLATQLVNSTLNDVSIAADASIDLVGHDVTATLNDVSIAADASVDLDSQSIAATIGSLDAQVTSNLVLAFGFEESSGTDLIDSSSLGNDGVLTVNGSRTVDGYFGQALLTDGANTAATVVHDASLDPTNITIEAWIYPTGGVGTWRCIARRQGANRVAFALYINSSNLLAFLIGDDVFYQANSAASVATGEWTHVAATYDGTSLQPYINGVASGAGTAHTGSIVYGNTSSLYIGSNHSGGEPFVGRIDELRIYNTALDATAISNDMATPIVSGTTTTATLSSQSISATLNDVSVATGVSTTVTGQPASVTLNDLDVVTGDAQADLAGFGLAATVGDLDVVDNTTPAPDARTVNIAADARIVFIEPALPGTFPPFSNSEVWVYGIPDLTASLGSLAVSAATNELVGHWRFNDDATNEVAGGQDGTLTNGPGYIAGQDGNAISFTAASSQYVEIPRYQEIESSAVTIAFWVRPSGSQAAYSAIVKKKYGDAGDPRGSWAVQTDVVTNQLFFAHGHIGGNSDLVTTSTIPTDGATWTHIVATYDPAASQKRIYINGTLDASDASNETIAYDSTASGNLFVGQNGRSAGYYDGAVDDLRVYNYALDQTAVTALYNSYSSGNATADLTGQGSSLSLNDLAVVGNATLTLDTQSLAAALGTLDPQAGTIVTLGGLPIGGTLGNLDATGSADLTLDTQALSAALGALGVTGDVTLLLVSHSLTATLGDVDVQAGNVTTTTLDSQALTPTLGNLNLTTGANFTLGTQALTVNLGSLTVSIPNLNVPAPDVRTITIAAQSRNITIAAFDRSTNISAQDKTITVTDQGRIINILLR